MFPLFTLAQCDNPWMQVHKDGAIVYEREVTEIDSITFLCNSEGKEHENRKNCVSVNRIYGDGSTYCAFTSLINRNNTFYLAFREGSTHVSEGDYGVIRILKSVDGEKWENYSTLKTDNIDLRDPNLSVMPDGRLLLICGGRYITKDGYYTTKSYYAIEKDEEFTSPRLSCVPQMIDDTHCCWIWKLTWHDNYAYGMAYRNDGRNRKASLVKTKDGMNYDFVCDIEVTGNPTEARIRFLDNEMICLLRRGTGTAECGFIGRSTSPYTIWDWKPLDIFLAGQDFIISEDRMLCITRTVLNICERTSLYIGDLAGNFNWCYHFPSSGSGGDTSYAGIIEYGKNFLVSFYSKHEEEKPSIYLATIPKNILPNNLCSKACGNWNNR